MQKHEAQAAYRAAWCSWLLARTPAEKTLFEDTMDACQPYCVEGPPEKAGPCPEWSAFIATLPGYEETWAAWRAKYLSM